jgi:hypothetical protein
MFGRNSFMAIDDQALSWKPRCLDIVVGIDIEATSGGIASTNSCCKVITAEFTAH